MNKLLSLILMTFCTGAIAQVKYVNTAFENASQADWKIDSATNTVQLNMIYDHERNSVNRANGHWHFQVEAEPGTDVTIILNNFENIWNGRPGYPVSAKTNCMISKDGKMWSHIPGEFADGMLKFKIRFDTEKLYFASVEPYRISDLEKFLAKIKGNPLIQITTVGKTPEGRPLEIIRIGNANAPHSVFLRARAHSWEPAGNWITEGLINSLLEKESAKYLKRYCIYIMPMANKDGVARGRTRFNTRGVDLNRKWDAPADSINAPEKHAFENWLKGMIAKGKKPDLAIDLHNDQGGNVHVNLPREDNKPYTARINKFVDLLYKHTWFTEGPSHVHNPGSFGEGMAKRFNLDGIIYEFNYEWAEGLKKVPMGEDWKKLGSQLREVFYQYFD